MARAVEEETTATKLAAEEVEAAATKLAAEEAEAARAAEEEDAGPAPPLDKEAIAMKGKGGGKAAEVSEVEVARAAEEEAAAKAKEVARVEEEDEAAATKLAAEEVEAARAVEEEAAGSAPPLDKEASAIAGQKHEGGEGLGGCERRELCYGAAGAGKKKSWPSNLTHAVLRAL